MSRIYKATEEEYWGRAVEGSQIERVTNERIWEIMEI